MSGVATGLKMRLSLTAWRTLVVESVTSGAGKSRSGCFCYSGECSDMTNDKGASTTHGLRVCGWRPPMTPGQKCKGFFSELEAECGP